MLYFNPGWFVIYTRPQHEKKVQADLIKRGLQTFLPCINTLRNWADRKKYVNTPLFPSYIFVYLESNQDYFMSLEAPGALYLLRSGKELAKVSPDVIEDIRVLLQMSYNVEVTTQRFKPGEQLLIQQGAFAGYHCEFVESNGFYKAIVRLNFMQRCLLVSLPEEYMATTTEKCTMS